MHSETVKINSKGSVKYITFPKLTESGVCRHAFSTRLSGVSKGFLSSMNLGFGRGDERENVVTNYRVFCDAVGIRTENLVFSKQTHTNNVLSVTEADRGIGFTRESFCDIDGLVTDRPGVALVTQYADCTPLLFCDPKRKVIAASHSGWRGTVQKIGEVTVEKMVREYGSCREDIIAAIGPCIGSCCYEVDTPVYDAFVSSGINLDGVFKRVDNEHFMLDLRQANKNILTSAGIKEENMDIADICTACNSDEMFSHRVLGAKRGNLAAIIELK